MTQSDRFRMDLHVHSIHSPDGLVRPREILKEAVARGLGGIAVVDHNSPLGGIRTAKRAAEDRKRYGRFIVVKGVEVSTADGHLIGMGLTEAPPKGKGLEESAEAIRDLGGIAVVPHFGRYISGITDADLVRRIRPEGVEVINRKSRRGQNAKALRLAEELGSGQTAGSDSHSMNLLGGAYVTFPGGRPRTEDDVIAAIVKGKTKAGGRGATIPESTRKMSVSGVRWLKRGGRRV